MASKHQPDQKESPGHASENPSPSHPLLPSLLAHGGFDNLNNESKLAAAKAQEYLTRTRLLHNVVSNPQIMREVNVAEILACFASSFQQSKHGTSFQSSLVEESHDESDFQFYSSRQTTSLDRFISHAWAASRLEKYLAMLYYVNVTTATFCAIAAWLTSLCLLFYQYDFRIFSFGGETWGLALSVRLCFFPVFVFYFVFFFGHHVRVFGRRDKYWLDKMCIHQTRSELKWQGVAALPEFVASSKRFVLLWSETYFERLWCNAEVATYCAVNGSMDSLDFQPLWLAPWVLVTIAMNFVGIMLFPVTVSLIPDDLGNICSTVFGHGTAVCIYFSQTLGICFCVGLAFMPAAITNYFSFNNKLKSHSQMLSQLKEYRLEGAKCAVEDDREAVYNHIRLLFRARPHLAWHEELPNDPLSRFDRFMQTIACDCCSMRLGFATRLPYRQSLLAFLPLIFESVVNVLNCDGVECHQGAAEEGYTNASNFLIGNAIQWMIGNALVCPLNYSLQLFLMDKIRSRLSGSWLIFVSIASNMSMYFLCGLLEGSMGGCIVNILTQGTFFWWVAGISYLGFLLCLNAKMYISSAAHSHS